MRRTDTAKIFALVAATYNMAVNELAVEAWHLLLADLDADQATTATKRLCRRDTPFPPRPGEIVAEVERINGTTPPSTEAALGFYLAGKWDRHPLIAIAAGRVPWDRNTAPDEAKWSFRSHYEAALFDHATGTSPKRQRLEACNQPVAIGDIEIIDEFHTWDPEHIERVRKQLNAARTNHPTNRGNDAS